MDGYGVAFFCNELTRMSATSCEETAATWTTKEPAGTAAANAAAAVRPERRARTARETRTATQLAG